MCINKNPILNEKAFPMEDNTVAGIIESLPLIANRILTNIEHFCEDREIDEKHYTVDYNKNCEISEQFSVALNSGKPIIRKLEENIQKNSTCVVKLQSDLEQLTNSMNSLKRELTEKATKKQTLQMKLSKLEKKREMLLKKRDQVQTFKLLTNTNFYLNSPDVIGYTFCKETQKIKPFEFNPRKTPKVDIVNSLYEKILTVFSRSPDNMEQ